MTKAGKSCRLMPRFGDRLGPLDHLFEIAENHVQALHGQHQQDRGSTRKN